MIQKTSIYFSAAFLTLILLITAVIYLAFGKVTSCHITNVVATITDSGNENHFTLSQKAPTQKFSTRAVLTGQVLAAYSTNFIQVKNGETPIWFWPAHTLVILLIVLLALFVVKLCRNNYRLKNECKELWEVTRTDFLTGMHNEKTFFQEVSKRVRNITEENGGVFIFVDGDEFKQINDLYGHSIGDEVIKLVARAICQSIGTKDLAARLHGDEFTIWIEGPADCAAAGKLMNTINTHIQKYGTECSLPQISVSAGFAIAHPGDSYHDLFNRADIALMNAKMTRSGKCANG